ncbi:MAG TPA: zinc-binding dehydrogenase [Trebonia sp.]|nr:zinc-binding dehydrogenase [Trebonia sp.]
MAPIARHDPGDLRRWRGGPHPRGRAEVGALIDIHGGDYVEIALNEFGVQPARADTIVRFDAVEKYGVKAEGNAAGASAETLRELAELVAKGELEVPIAAAYPLDQVREAYQRLETGYLRGKIALIPLTARRRSLR